MVQRQLHLFYHQHHQLLVLYDIDLYLKVVKLQLVLVLQFIECLRILRWHILFKYWVRSRVLPFQHIYSLIFLKLKLLHTSIILIMVLFLVLKLTNLTAFSKYSSSVYSYAVNFTIIPNYNLAIFISTNYSFIW